ncbi:MAG: response regulator [Gammaproteobacteria bacterium]|nr:response regulator [Gammaproteobacteria bacterium]
MKIRSKLIISFFILSLISLLVVTAVVYDTSRKSLTEIGYSRLASIKEEKKFQIQSYFENIMNAMAMFSRTPATIDAAKDLSQAFSDLKGVRLSKDMDDNLRDFYQKEFVPKIDSNLESVYPLSQVGRYLQYYYISSNSFGLGDKNKLDNVVSNDEYFKEHYKYHSMFQDFRDSFGFYDVFIVDMTGDIVYSVYKETDYATNLLTGPYSNQNISKVYQKAVKNNNRGGVFVDYAPYIPSYSSPACFISILIKEGERAVGVLIAQVSQKRINNIMTSGQTWESKGLGKTGETYLVGSDYLMRSDSRFLIEEKADFIRRLNEHDVKEDIVSRINEHNTTIMLLPVVSESVRRGIRGEEGTQIIEDYRGEKVLSSFSALNIKGLEWVIVSEIDVEEVMAPVIHLKNVMVVSTAIIVMFIVAMATVMGIRFTYPIIYLLNACSDFGRGVMSLLPLVNRNDEFKQLGEVMIQADRRIMKQRLDLEDEVSRRRKLQVSLMEARERAEIASKAKTQFLGQMSHELRTPLNHIVGFAQLLEYDEGLSDQQKDSVGEIISSGRNLTEIIDKMLQYSDMMSEHHNITISEFDVGNLVISALHGIEMSAKEKSIKISLSEDFKQDYKVIGDEQGAAVVLAEILKNAVQFNVAHGEIKIDSDFGRNGYFGVKVCDTGAGIEKDGIDEIFVPFSRMNKDTTISGVGIGLSNAYRLATSMAGDIHAESEVGVGSCFTVYFPNQSSKPSYSFDQLEKIVYVDDDPDMISIVEFSIESHGEIAIEVFSSPVQALSLIPEIKPDLMLLDYIMPEYDGVDLLKELRKNEAVKDVPVIFISGNSNEDLSSKYRDLGVIGYILKPIDPVALPSRILEIWNSNSSK